MLMITQRRHYVASARKDSRHYASDGSARREASFARRRISLTSDAVFKEGPRAHEAVRREDAARRPIAARLAAVAAAAVAFGLAGCGSSDGSVGVGSGQEPDPVAIDFPIAYTKGPLFDEEGNLIASSDVRDVQRFNVGTDLYLRDRASPSAPERNITFPVTQGMGDVRGVEISPDGTKVLFAMRGPFDPDLDEDEQPTWNIWEYDIPTATLRRIIASDIFAEEGHDISPHYLADDRIIFASTRQRTAKAILLDEGKPQFEALDENRNEPAFVLHVMNADGSDIRQVSFNQSHDYDPILLSSGKVLFSRWDRAGTVNGIHLYRMNPDGSELELLYGAESHATGTADSQVQFLSAREMRDGRIMAIVRPFEHDELGGAAVVIDVEAFVENTQPIARFAGLPGPAQTLATPNLVRTDAQPSVGGRYSSVFPLWDGTNRILAAWAICRLAEPDPADPESDRFVPCTDERLASPAATAAPPLYGIWMYDPGDGTQLPIVVGEEGVLIAEAVAAQPRVRPIFIPDKTNGAGLDGDLVAENAGILNIRSVYDVDGVASVSIAATADPVLTPPAARPALFLRVEKAVSIPDEDVVDLDNTAFGPNIRQGMREIVAYAPIEPDGSVRVKVPANVPLAVSVLDAAGRRISPRHQNWLQVPPGAELRCNGCHDPQSGLSHGRAESFTSAYAGALGNGVPFPNTRGMYSPNVGETMAETRTRIEAPMELMDIECPETPAAKPSVDVYFCDPWTDLSVQAAATSFSYRYERGPYMFEPGVDHGVPVPPTSENCRQSWSAGCRIVINYEQHIHPLWSAPRQVLAADGVTVLEDHTCSSGGCHAPVDANGAAAVPQAQLDLSDGLSADEPDHFNAYRELLFADTELELVGGALRERLVLDGFDTLGNPIFSTVSVSPSMSAAGARASRFFNVFAPGGTHAGRLSNDELRLIAEWLDIGAQYYNDPFAVPEM